jgi:hypothetical protein
MTVDDGHEALRGRIAAAFDEMIDRELEAGEDISEIGYIVTAAALTMMCHIFGDDLVVQQLKSTAARMDEKLASRIRPN